MDSSAWFEVFLGGRWCTFDARHNHPVSAASSWQAAGTPLMLRSRQRLGWRRLRGFSVLTEEVRECETASALITLQSLAQAASRYNRPERRRFSPQHRQPRLSAARRAQSGGNRKIFDKGRSTRRCGWIKKQLSRLASMLPQNRIRPTVGQLIKAHTLRFLTMIATWMLIFVAFVCHPEWIHDWLRLADQVPEPRGARLEIMLRELGEVIWIQVASTIVLLRLIIQIPFHFWR
jgi:hypothetical protein